MRKIWQAIWNRRRFENELTDEMQFHMEARAADLERTGHPKDEARRRARLEMGSTEHYKEVCRQARGLRWLDEFRLDLLYALRGLRRNRVFALVAIATLTLGIGANAGIFALVNSVLLKALPVDRPEELQAVYWTLPEEKRTFHRSSSGRSFREGNLRVADMFAYSHFVRLRADLSPKADLFGHVDIGRINVLVGGQAQLARGLAVSWNYFRALRVTPYLGRTFLPEDEAPGALAPAAILSHRYWSNAFAGDRSILGRPLTIGDGKAIVVGILPPDFHGINPGEPLDVVVTLTAWDDMNRSQSLMNPRRWWVRMMARLEPDLPATQFKSELETRLIAALHAEPVKDRYDAPKIRLIDGARGLHWLRSEFERPLRLLMIVALLILLMSAVNVGGLMLARSEARGPETGARLALGAGRLRLLRQHLTESFLIASLGLAGGLLLAALLGKVLPTLLARSGEAPVLDLAPDWRFIAIALLAAAVVALLFGLYPAWKTSRVELTASLKRTHGARSGRLPMGRVLVAIQIGLSLVLLITAATFLRTVVNLRSVTLGFVPERVLVFAADPSLAGYRDERVIQFYKKAMRNLSSAPGVRSVSIARHGLLHGWSSSSDFYYRGNNGQLESLGARVHAIARGYFETVGIPLLAGRDVRDADTSKASRVVLVNQKLARIMRPDGGSPIGQLLFDNRNGERPAEIVGIVGDAKYDAIRAEAPATVYAPFAQTSIRGATFFVKTNGDPLTLANSVHQIMRDVDSRVPIYDLRTQEEQISLAMERERILAKLLAAFGTLALLLAAIGVYGVLSYSVTRRTSEIGIRLALGAAPRTLRAMIVREAFLPFAIGSSLGLAAAWWFTQLLKGFLFGVKPMDALSIAGAVAVLTFAAVLAATIPAHRASRVSPINALRYE